MGNTMPPEILMKTKRTRTKRKRKGEEEDRTDEPPVVREPDED